MWEKKKYYFKILHWNFLCMKNWSRFVIFTLYFFIVPMQKLLPAAAAKIPNFVGLKFTSRDCAEAGSCTRLKRSNGKPYTFYFGSDEVYLDHWSFLILLINLFLIIICKIVLCTILVYLIMKLFTPTRLILVIMDLELNLQSVHLIILLLNYSIK